MRIKNITIENWRNIANVEIVPPPHAGMVCLIGENGTGKSSVLELLNAAAFKFNLKSGGIVGRNPYSEPHRFQVTLDLSSDLELLDAARRRMDGSSVDRPNGDITEPIPEEARADWDGTLILHSERGQEHGSSVQTVLAGGIVDAVTAAKVADRVTEVLHRANETLFLSVDAIRHPPNDRTDDRDAGSREASLDSPRMRGVRESMAQRRSRWIDEFLERERAAAEQHWSMEHQAAEDGLLPPTFANPNVFFGASVQELLPHIKFVRADLTAGDLVFDVGGHRVPLMSLSSGEQEVIFLVGLLEPLQFQRGLLSLDEPELRLNPTLLGAWFGFLQRHVGGQVWLGTHSFEAVKAAGPEATFLFTRSASRHISVKPLADAPILATVGAAIGWPAYSLKRRFLLVEGDANSRNDDLARFSRLLVEGGQEVVDIFVEQGCSGVIATYRGLCKLSSNMSSEEREQLRIGAIVDRDHRSTGRIERLQCSGIHVLGCHELENLFLHPVSIAAVTQDRNESAIRELIRNAADENAGAWIVERARERGAGSLSLVATQFVRRLQWSDIEAELDGLLAKLASVDGPLKLAASEALGQAVWDFRGLRTDDELWRECHGKQVEKMVAARLGYTSYHVFESKLHELWSGDYSLIPEPLAALRHYVQSLGAFTVDCSDID